MFNIGDVRKSISFFSSLRRREEGQGMMMECFEQNIDIARCITWAALSHVTVI